MSTLKSKFALGKLGLTLALMIALIVVLFQNTRPVAVELLFWEVNLPLTFLLLGVSLISATILFFIVLIKGRA